MIPLNQESLLPFTENYRERKSRGLVNISHARLHILFSRKIFTENGEQISKEKRVTRPELEVYFDKIQKVRDELNQILEDVPDILSDFDKEEVQAMKEFEEEREKRNPNR